MGRTLKIALFIAAPFVVFAAMIGVDRAFGAPGGNGAYVQRLELPPASREVDLPAISGPDDASRPLVVIDAGHGGHDPGAGEGALQEKRLTLALAQALRDRLLEKGGIRVAMTRDSDRYLLLEERSGMARRLNADLFISLHADSAERQEANGASIYTLSERGTSQTAARYAERENRADRINGVLLEDKGDTVSAILVDLSQRESQAQAGAFAKLVLREGQGRLRFRPEPLQSAALAVLKVPDMPSVLIETGYISNAGDADWLLSDEGRNSFADVTARAIRLYFARRSAR
jgi:N-acetylmuramoyl-L-alanine amidase